MLVNGTRIPVGATSVPLARPWTDWRIQGRLDHHFSGKDTLSYRYYRMQLYAPVSIEWPFSNNDFGRRFASYQDSVVQMNGLTHTHIFTPALVNQVRLSANRRADSVVSNNDSAATTTITGVGVFGPNVFSPFIRPNDSYDLQDVLTWTRGRHSIKIGLELLKINDVITSTQRSVWTFTNLEDFVNNRANNLALLLGNSVEPFRSLRQNYFVQDDFKAAPHLTLNLGLRYQVANIPSGLFSAATPEVEAMGVPGRPKPDRNDFAPRFGFAYSPPAREGFWKRLLGTGSTVVRGGYALGYGLLYEGETGSLLSLVGNYPWNLPLGLTREQLTNTYPAGPLVNQPAPGITRSTAFWNYSADGENPVTHFYSLSIQRAIRGQYVVELGYMGNRAYHTFQRLEQNPGLLSAEQAQTVLTTRNSGSIPGLQMRRLNPNWGSRTGFQSVGRSNYNAGYWKLDRRFSRGLLIGANYTWSASLSHGEGNSALDQGGRAEYGRASMDRPHRFVIHYVWQTPGKRVWGGWRISGVSQWQSGRPFSVTTGVDSNGNGTNADRPAYHPAGTIAMDPVTGDWRSFTTPLDGRGVFVTPLGNNGLPLQYSVVGLGGLGRNTFRGPAFSLWNLSVMKPFAIRERVRMEFRVDTTNLFNHRNFGPAVSSMNDANFGRNTSNPQSRAVLLGAKIRF